MKDTLELPIERSSRLKSPGREEDNTTGVEIGLWAQPDRHSEVIEAM